MAADGHFVGNAINAHAFNVPQNVLPTTPTGASPGRSASWLDFFKKKKNSNNNGEDEAGVGPVGVPSSPQGVRSHFCCWNFSNLKKDEKI